MREASHRGAVQSRWEGVDALRQASALSVLALCCDQPAENCSYNCLASLAWSVLLASLSAWDFFILSVNAVISLLSMVPSPLLSTLANRSSDLSPDDVSPRPCAKSIVDGGGGIRLCMPWANSSLLSLPSPS